jgi:pyruvate,water dikinase
MVGPMTSATGTPLFGIIAGLITDSGGELSHPVIVSREYGIPAVCGTVLATQKLKTGDRVKIDANKMRVYKLD